MFDPRPAARTCRLKTGETADSKVCATGLTFAKRSGGRRRASVVVGLTLQMQAFSRKGLLRRVRRAVQGSFGGALRHSSVTAHKLTGVTARP